MPHVASSIYDSSPIFRMARKQLDAVAGVVDLHPDVLARMAMPKRALLVSVPVRRDDGHIDTFAGYRVQHSLTSAHPKAAWLPPCCRSG